MALLTTTDASWVGNAIWAIVVIVFLILFRAPITRFLERLSQMKAKADKSGIELSFQAGLAEAGNFIALAQESKSDSLPADRTPDKKNIAQTVQVSAPEKQAERFSRSEILWVDDRPDNNNYERRAFEAIGLRFTLARSTEQALNILQRQSFSAIISDMGRPPDARAGYTLLDEIRRRNDKTPFVIYAGSRSPEHKRETAEHGGQGCTNHPEELFKLVLKAIIEAPTA